MERDAEPKKGDEFLGSFVWGAERPGDPRREDARREADAGAPRRTGIMRRDVALPSGEVAFEGRRWRATIRLLGHFGAAGEFMEVHRTRKG